MNTVQPVNSMDSVATQSNTVTKQSLREFLEQTLEIYFQHIDPTLPPTQLYNLVLEEIEQPLLQCALKFTKGNQCKAALMLGISRSTLRKKLKIYGLDQKD